MVCLWNKRKNMSYLQSIDYIAQAVVNEYKKISM